MRRTIGSCMQFTFLTLCAATSTLAAQQKETYSITLPSQELADSILALGDVIGADIWLTREGEKHAGRAPAISGNSTGDEHLQALLAGSALVFQHVGENGIEICYRKCGSEISPRSIPEMLVTTSRINNADIPRTSEDAQPSIVISREQVERARGASLEDIIRDIVPYVSVPTFSGAYGSMTGEFSQLDARGLGRKQTLLLLDGRRTGNRTLGGDPLQGTLGIPTEAIERIEILGTSATSRHGGNAIGGVVNVVQRAAATGLRIAATADSVFDTPSTKKEMFAEYGFHHALGQASVWLDYSSASMLLMKDWDVISPARKQVLHNNPLHAQSLTGPPLSNTTTVLLERGQQFAIPAGTESGDDLFALLNGPSSYSTSLAQTSQNQGALSAIRPKSVNESAHASTDIEIIPNLTADLELAYARIQQQANSNGADTANLRRIRLEANDPSNPLDQPLWVTAPFSVANGLMRSDQRLRRGRASLKWDITSDWSAIAEYEQWATKFTLTRPILLVSPEQLSSLGVDLFASPINEAPLKSRMATHRLPDLSSTMRNFSLRMAGSAWRLPAGEADWTLLLERRKQALVDRPVSTALLGLDGSVLAEQAPIPPQHENTTSAYAEAHLPLMAGHDLAPGHSLLGLELTVRGDDYRIQTAQPLGPPTAPSFNYSSYSFSAMAWTAAARFEPIEGLSFRSGCGTGFTPPTAIDLSAPIPQTLNTPLLRDPKLNREPVGKFLLIVGGNGATRPEHSRQCTAGIVSETHDGRFRSSVDFTKIWQHDAIYAPADSVFNHFEDIVQSLPFRVTRDPITDRILIVDATTLNVSDRKMKAVDFSADYRFPPTGLGTFHLSSFTSFEPVLESRISSLAPWVNESGIGSAGQARWRGTLSLVWGRGAWSAGWAARITSRSRVSNDEAIQEDQGGENVKFQHFHDLWVGYEFEHTLGPFSHVQVVLGGKNVLRTRPRLDAADQNLSSHYGSGELPQASLTVRMSQD